MEVLRGSDVERIERRGEVREYYDATHSRIVITHVPPGHEQNEHRHERLYDITMVMVGELVVNERNAAGEVSSTTLRAGDMVVFAPGPTHNVANRSDRVATTMTLKFVAPQDLSREAFSNLCRTDWHATEPYDAR